MIKRNEDRYIVLEHKSYPGLTVGSYSQKPGTIFYSSQWTFSEEDLRNAIAEKRCKLLKPKKVKENDSK